MNNLSIMLFGPARVTAGPDAQPVRLGRSAASLLVFLCLHHGRPVQREIVASELWPDAAPDRVQSRLSTAIWRLRGALKDHVSIDVLDGSDTGALALSTDLVDLVDIVGFERDARAYLDGVDGAECPQAARYDVEEPLAGWYDVWALSARIRLQDLREACLSKLLEEQIERAQIAPATETAEALLATDPLREDIYQALMRLAARQGRPGLVTRQYERCRAALMDELDIEPSPDTKALLHELQLRASPAAQCGTPAKSDRAALNDMRRTLQETQANLARVSTQLDQLLGR